MRAHIVVGTGLLRDRAEVIEKYERPDRLALRCWQQTANHEAAAQVVVARGDEVKSRHGGSFTALVSVVRVQQGCLAPMFDLPVALFGKSKTHFCDSFCDSFFVTEIRSTTQNAA